MTKLQFNFYKFTRSGTEEEFTELNQLLEDNYLRTSLFTCETLLRGKNSRSVRRSRKERMIAEKEKKCGEQL